MLKRSWTPDSFNKSRHMTGEDSVAVVNDGDGEAMQVHNVVEERAGDQCRLYGWLRAIKWVYLKKRLTTVRMTDDSLTLGSPSMKSIEISAQT